MGLKDCSHLLFSLVFAWLLDLRVAPMCVLIISREKTAVHENWISKSKSKCLLFI